MFTKPEWDIIEHRLQVPDAIADSLSEIYNYNIVFNRACKIQESKIFDLKNSLDYEIIRECCEGSTFFADIEESKIEGSLTKGQIMSYYKAAYKLEEKLGLKVCTI